MVFETPFEVACIKWVKAKVIMYGTRSVRFHMMYGRLIKIQNSEDNCLQQL